MRHIVQIEVENATLVGTYHQPPLNNDSVPCDTGLLILNTGAAPRSGDGDLNAQLADRMMDLGYHVFRFDMPGLGDSPGDLPENLLTYYTFVRNGGNAPIATCLVSALRRTYRLKGLVLLGNCGGSVTAMYVAAKKPDGVLGLVNFDPVFHNREASMERAAQGPRPKKPAPASLQNHGMKNTLRQCLGRLPGGQLATNMYRAIAKRRFPKDTYFTLVHLWKQLEQMKMPMLVLLSHKIQDDAHLRVLLRKSSPQTTCVEIKNTNHFFSTDDGKSQVFDEVKRWLLKNVPPHDKSAGLPAATQSPVPETQHA
jgi:pimeloyl-ACP methyl ester carboxylesterase